MDASKAFDRVKFDKLIFKKIDRNVCPVLSRLMLYMYTNQNLNVKCPVLSRPMLYMYTNQSLNVKWNNSNSSTFCVSNGVKQGAVLSSVLFNIYTDELLNNFKKSHNSVILGMCTVVH